MGHPVCGAVLLIGIVASFLTHQDIDRYRGMFTHRSSQLLTELTCVGLVATYGHRPKDIAVLIDDPAFPDHLQPTCESIVSPFPPAMCSCLDLE
jgi:hypothetical protein